MCGLSFYYSMRGHRRSELEESLQRTKHRGPDSSGVEFFSFSAGFVGLGHNRLSIIDTSNAGYQPMTRSQVTVVFNGEIYNFSPIREDLIQRGYTFVSRSDTEVILAAYKEFGVDCFGLFKGMFSFVIVDGISNKLYVVRDTLGIKPIYLFQTSEEIYGCSEIKGLKAYSEVDCSISRQDVFEFFNNGFLYEPNTGFSHIRKLLPGNYLEVDLEKNTRITRRFRYVQRKQDYSELKDLLAGTIANQQVSDVPLGVFFSGGVDSSIIASMAKQSDLLFAKYDRDPVSDLDLAYSTEIADYLGKEIAVNALEMESDDAEEVLKSFQFVAEHTEELISDYTFWSTYLLSRSAKESGYTVMLSGMGGDEIFAGYPRYLVVKYHYLLKWLRVPLALAGRFKLFPKSLSKKFDRLVSYISEPNWAVSYSRLLGYFSSSELEQLFADSKSLQETYVEKLNDIESEYIGDPSDKVKLAQFLDLKGFLSHNLMVSDKASMLASIELRVPLLDEDIVQYGLEKESSVLIKRKSLKDPLKMILRSTIPDSLIDRPKAGFNPPLDGLINKIGKKRIIQELSPLSQYVSMVPIHSMVEGHFNGQSNNTYKMWQLLYFSQWLRSNQ